MVMVVSLRAWRVFILGFLSVILVLVDSAFKDSVSFTAYSASTCGSTRQIWIPKAVASSRRLSTATMSIAGSKAATKKNFKDQMVLVPWRYHWTILAQRNSRCLKTRLPALRSQTFERSSQSLTQRLALQTLGLEDVPTMVELRVAFRKKAARAHPDVGGGSEETFRRVVDAYRQLSSEQDSGVPKIDAVDDFIADWRGRGPDICGWGSFAQIEKDTDNDGWAGRQAVLNSFVKRHDAAVEGGVQEGDVVIYRLMSPMAGKGWGVGYIVAIQVRYSSLGPNGLLHVQPLRLSQRGLLGFTVLEEDLDAEISMTRVVDRLEVLDGVDLLPDGSVQLKESTSAHTRAILSKMVYFDGHRYLT